MTAGTDAAARLAGEVARAARRAGARRTLMLDLDGTLAPIAPTPDAARVPERTLAAISELLRTGWTVAVISGRPLAEVRRMVPLRGVRAFGSHGLEDAGDGRRVRLDPLLRNRLGRLAREGRDLARTFSGAWVERKPAGLAFHDRNVPRGELKAWRRSLRELLAREDLDGLERLEGRRVVEIRVRGVHKGLVVDSVLGHRSGTARRDPSVVAIGDDRTDEDMFRAIRGRGLAVRVGRSRARTLATRRLPSPMAVQRFLLRVARAEAARRGGGA